MIFCLSIAALLTGACLFAGAQLTGLVVGRHQDLQHIGADYLIARGPTLLLLVPFTLLAATFNAYRRPGYAAAAALAVNLANISLDWLLIYGPGPFPRLGAVGNGLATTMAWLLGVGWLLVVAHRMRLGDILRRQGSPTTPVDFTTAIPRLAWPAMVSSAFDYVGLAVFFLILADVGESALAGGRVAYEVMVLLFGLGTAFAAASRILIGRAVGAGLPAESTTMWRAGQRVLLAPALVFGGILVVLPRACASVFTSFTPVLDSAAEALPLVGVCIPLIAWTLGNTSVLRALGQTRWDMNANLVAALAVQLPLGWFLAGPAGLGVAGAFGGVIAYWLARALITEVLARRCVGMATRSTNASK